jgi:AcrR family transcriptional regulator
VEARTRNPRGEGDRLRATLLDVATELLAEVRDVERLSVRAVTAKAGVSPTALYLHFADKDALVVAIEERCFAALRARLEVARDAHPDDPWAGLRAMGGAYLTFAREDPGWYGVCFQAGGHEDVVGDAWDAHPTTGVGMDVFGLLVTQVVRCSGLDEAAAFDRATVLWAALHGRSSLLAAMPGFPFADEDRWLTLLTGGWGTDGGGSAGRGAAPPSG